MIGGWIRLIGVRWRLSRGGRRGNLRLWLALARRCHLIDISYLENDPHPLQVSQIQWLNLTSWSEVVLAVEVKQSQSNGQVSDEQA